MNFINSFIAHNSNGKSEDNAMWTATKGVELLIGSKVQCLFCYETCPTKGRGKKREGVQISEQSTQNL